MGIKVWICNGEKYGKQDLSPNAGFAANAQAPTGGRREGGRGDRRGRGGRGGDRRERGERRDRDDRR
jgi:small subunit ribosomal protein S3